MRRHLLTPGAVARWLSLPVLVGLAAWLAVSLHRSGHTQGDDFALYLRQARSIFDGDIGAVVADNRFAVLNSDSAFSPIAYPWVWPLLLSPFVNRWGLDYDRLKLVEVGLYCIWLVLLHGIVRRRIGRIAALAFVAVFATAPAYLAHTDQLLTEIPHLVAVAAFVWWYDRIRRNDTLIGAPPVDLVILGLFVTLAFNVRRESVVLLGVIAVMQVYDLVQRIRAEPARSAEDITGPPVPGTDEPPDGTVAVVPGTEEPDNGTVSDLRELLQVHGRAVLIPYLSFAVSAALFQLLLPTALLPDNGNDSAFLDDRMSEYPAILSEQLGLGAHTAVGVVLLLVAALGVAIGVRRRPTLDGPLATLALFSALAISTHLRRVDRYWFQVTPWVVYFFTVACIAAVAFAGRQLVSARTRDASREPVADRVPNEFTRRASATRDDGLLRRWGPIVAIVPLLVVVVIHLAVLPGRLDEAREFNDVGRVQSGPSNPAVAPIFEVVSSLTPPDSIIAYYRARTMTLLTDRRSFQTKSLERIAQNADYFAQRRDSTYWQPALTPEQARVAGWEEIWSSARWILWRIPGPGET